jgi:FlaG/FlaF family flagellin (archaellin)
MRARLTLALLLLLAGTVGAATTTTSTTAPPATGRRQLRMLLQYRQNPGAVVTEDCVGTDPDAMHLHRVSVTCTPTSVPRTVTPWMP